MDTTTSAELPHAGDIFECEQCGMRVTLDSDCKCETGTPTLECCGFPLSKA